MMTFKEFEKAVHDFDSYLGDDFYNYVRVCINGGAEENEIFDAPVIFECSDNARRAHQSKLKARAGIYLFVMNCVVRQIKRCTIHQIISGSVAIQ